MTFQNYWVLYSSSFCLSFQSHCQRADRRHCVLNLRGCSVTVVNGANNADWRILTCQQEAITKCMVYVLTRDSFYTHILQHPLRPWEELGVAKELTQEKYSFTHFIFIFLSSIDLYPNTCIVTSIHKHKKAWSSTSIPSDWLALP